MELITIEDHFVDNSINWWTGKNENGGCEIINGAYVIEHTRETDDYSVCMTLSIIESKAYSMEASFTFLNGYTKNGFGFLWGQKSNSEGEEAYAGFHYFVISASGKYVIRSYNPETKIAEPIKDWTDSAFINKGENQVNILKIIKFDDTIDKKLYFLINDQIVFQSDYLPFFGYETGFILFQNMKISIDYFKANFYFDQSLTTNKSN